MDRIPILLDTDIGSDIDDAVALAYLLRQPACELPGMLKQLPLPGAPKPHLVAAQVDPAAFFAHYFEIVGA